MSYVKVSPFSVSYLRLAALERACSIGHEQKGAHPKTAIEYYIVIRRITISTFLSFYCI